MEANHACQPEQITVAGDGPPRLSYVYQDSNGDAQIRQIWTFSGDPSKVKKLSPEATLRDDVRLYFVFFWPMGSPVAPVLT